VKIFIIHFIIHFLMLF